MHRHVISTYSFGDRGLKRDRFWVLILGKSWCNPFFANLPLYSNAKICDAAASDDEVLIMDHTHTRLQRHTAGMHVEIFLINLPSCAKEVHIYTYIYIYMSMARGNPTGTDNVTVEKIFYE